MASSKLLSFLLICIVLGAALPMMTEAGLPCPKIEALLAPCLKYLQKGGAPNINCCNGVKKLVSSATTTKDRQDACRCLQESAGRVTGLVPAFAEALPSKCGAKIPYKISKSTNCNSVR